MTIKLGDKVKDQVTGLEGIAIGTTQWLTGCARITVQPPMGKDGKIPEMQSFDETQLVCVKAGAVKIAKEETLSKNGGPMPTPKRH